MGDDLHSMAFGRALGGVGALMVWRTLTVPTPSCGERQGSQWVKSPISVHRAQDVQSFTIRCLPFYLPPDHGVLAQQVACEILW